VKIERVELRHLRAPLRSPFHAPHGIVDSRSLTLVSLWSDGLRGTAESVALDAPTYTAETHLSVWHILKDFIAPALVGAEINSPEDFQTLFSYIRGNPMARAAAECAIWDLTCRARGESLHSALGGTRTRVPAGRSIGMNRPNLIDQIAHLHAHHFHKIKIKIAPGCDVSVLEKIRSVFGDGLPLMADANSAYHGADMAAVRSLDRFQLMMIEQPLAWNDLAEHAELQAHMQTPLCLDESITCLHDAALAIRLHACRIINLKIGRVGGLSEARTIHNFCLAHSIPVWCGGMFELGIGRAFNLALASLPGFTIPGDTCPTETTFDHDIITSPLPIDEEGYMPVPSGPGSGVEPDDPAIDALTQHKLDFH
jgi:o-succinylbenzoate synthase